MTQLHDMTVAEVAAGLKAKTFSATEVAQHFVARAQSDQTGSFLALNPEATLAQDVVPGFSALGWFGYVAPAGTPPDVVEKLNKGINAAIAQPAVTEKLQNLGLVVVNESPQYFDKVLRADFERYGQIVKAIGYQPQ